jgi:PAS domain S-box-containing protein
MFGSFKIGTKLLLVTVIITVVVILVNGLYSSRSIRDTVKEQTFAKLTAVREMKAQQIEDYFEQISNQILTFSENMMIISAMGEFTQGFNTIDSEINKDEQTLQSSLKNYYQQEFVPRLNKAEQTKFSVQEYLPQQKNSKLLQSLFIANNANKTGEKHLLNNANNGSSYEDTHQSYHPTIRSYLEKFHYYDVFLVDAKTGNIVYSVYKEIDYATNLINGPHKDSNIAQVFQLANKSNDKDFVKIVDFSPYIPSYYAPAAFIASPIFNGDEKIGVLIFQMPINRINDIMTNKESWNKVGLGVSGETYIVGEDLTLRNQSRFLIEDKSNYLAMIKAIGADEKTLSSIESLNTSIGLQRVDTQGTNAALTGLSSTAIFEDYRGVSVLSAFGLLDINGLHWAIMSEIDEAEAFQSYSKLRDQVIMLSSVLITLAIYISYYLSISLTRPLRKLEHSAELLTSGDLETKIERVSNDEIGDLSTNFENMRLALKKSFLDVEHKKEELEVRVEERTQELNKILAEQEQQNLLLGQKNIELETIQGDLLTSRKAIENSEQRVATIIQSSPDGIITIDKKGTILSFNYSAEKLFGYQSIEIIDKNLKILMPKSIALEHDYYLEKYIPNSKSSIVGQKNEVFGQRKDGSQFPLELKVEQVFIDDELMFIGLIRDITEQKQLQQDVQDALDAAQKASQAKSGFLANMSHELRTPMNAIIGYSEMLAEDAEDDGLDDMLDDLNKITAAGKHLLSLINDVLDISKIEAGRMDLYLEDFTLGEIILDVASTAQSLVGKNNNKLTTNISDDLELMHADVTKVRQILFNLVSNSAKFTTDGEITISAKPLYQAGEQMVQISVADTGIGIPANKIETIFEEFSQADESTTRNYGGTGLGLALVKKFCEMMGGTIYIESAEGEGSTFIFELPTTVIKQDEELESAPQQTLNQVTENRLDSSLLKDVLVIDDDPQARDLLKRNLEIEGYSVITIDNGKDGIELAKKYHPSLITLDIMMPEMDGWEVLRALKAENKTKDIPVVMISIVGDKAIGASLGAVEHLSKPVDRNLLKEVVLKFATRGKALVIDDEQNSLDIAEKSLSSIGWKTVTAVNGQDGLEKFSANKVDLILLDIMMPVMDGFEFLTQLRSLPKGRDVPVIVLTAKDLSDDEKLILNGNVEHVFSKEETSVEQLVADINEQFGKR